ncbi:MAG: T9SS type A sorting domain-containing protein, partial [Flavobacteriaceae bacterium]|nr:T9SS type A sorting domain-containing protein [Flavobacteriaceae bacterium]
LDAGDYLNRFFIAFSKSKKTLDLTDITLESTIVNYLNSTDEIYINVPNTIDVKQVYLINLLGQTVKSWNISNMLNISSNEFKIPVKNIAEGAYIIKVETNSSTINKRIIVKQ